MESELYIEFISCMPEKKCAGETLCKNKSKMCIIKELTAFCKSTANMCKKAVLNAYFTTLLVQYVLI